MNEMEWKASKFSFIHSLTFNERIKIVKRMHQKKKSNWTELPDWAPKNDDDDDDYQLFSSHTHT